MEVSTRILMVVGVFLALATQAKAQGFSPYGGDTQAGAKQMKPSDGFAPAQGTKAARAPAATGAGALGIDSYKIGPSDLIEISVFGVPELSVTAQVGDDGNLQLPLLGPTPAAGKTAEQLQKELTARLGADYLQHPQVSVLVKEFNSRFVILTGAIKNGIVPLKGETTLLEVIAGAGGFGDAANSTVLLLREKGGKRVAASYDVSAIEQGKAPDVVLQSGDRIVAGKSAIKQAYSLFLKALPVAGAAALVP
jgi:polysaccharide biosynthesis/export protein